MDADKSEILKRRVQDAMRLCEKYAAPRFTGFLDEAEQAFLGDGFSGGMYFGGTKDAKRRVLGFFPDWQEPCGEDFPISCVKISNRAASELSHRDYLGTVMSLGIDRSKIGDINIDGSCAYMFVISDIARHIADNITKIANCGVSCNIIPVSEAPEYEERAAYTDTVAASMRLDACVAAAFALSRKNAAELISQGRVEVNHIACEKPARELCAGDLMSVRGFGRAEIAAVGGDTRSGRQHITIKKFI